MKYVKRLTLAAALSVTMASAFAGDWYAVGSIGQSKVKDFGQGDLDAALVAAGATGVSSTLDDKDTGYKLQLGYRFTPNFSVEGGYVNLGKFNYNATFTGGTANAEIKATGFNVEGVGTFPINEQFSVFGKLGFIDGKLEEGFSATGPGGAASIGASATKLKVTGGLGATYNVTKSVGVRAEWERFKFGDSGTTGEGNIDLMSVGLVYNF